MSDHPIGTKQCTRCGEEKPMSRFNIIKSGKYVGWYYSMCRACQTIKTREWTHRTGKARPMAEAKDSAIYLGVYVAERALSGYFDHIQKMPYGNPGYDFICGRGFKIDVKSSCRIHTANKSDHWNFHTSHNRIADYFLCLAFDNRQSLNPEHIWLVPSEFVVSKESLVITDYPKALKTWSKYERPLDRVIACCAKLSEAMT